MAETIKEVLTIEQTVLIAAVTAIATTIFTEPIKKFLGYFGDKAVDKRKQIARRRSPGENVVRQALTNGSIRWRVNPFWIYATSPLEARIKSLEDIYKINVLFVDQLRGPNRPDFLGATVKDARKMKDWLCFIDIKGHLNLDSQPEPSDLEDQCLFQPLPHTWLEKLRGKAKQYRTLEFDAAKWVEEMKVKDEEEKRR